MWLRKKLQIINYKIPSRGYASMNNFSKISIQWQEWEGETIELQIQLALFLFCLFGVLRRFQHCTGHITTGSWKGRGNQYIEFARVVHCKLPTNGKQLPAFPLEPVRGSNPGIRGGRQECYHSATMAPYSLL